MAQLRVQVIKVAERASQEEVFAYVAEWPLDLGFLSSPGLQFVLTLKRV
ncbi:hypothetical protein USDA257_p04890 (plasmid) [Sinorhizobium fredii USDA 257]|nr:hypothetical protein USDA257_p04890 [Sinorhizobium fredii USDA 257]